MVSRSWSRTWRFGLPTPPFPSWHGKVAWEGSVALSGVKELSRTFGRSLRKGLSPFCICNVVKGSHHQNNQKLKTYTPIKTCKTCKTTSNRQSSRKHRKQGSRKTKSNNHQPSSNQTGKTASKEATISKQEGKQTRKTREAKEHRKRQEQTTKELTHQPINKETTTKKQAT